MGIKQLFNLILLKAPQAVEEIKKKTKRNKVLAVDAAMVMYQFLTAQR